MFLPAKEAIVKVQVSTRNEIGCKGLCFYPERKQSIEDWIEVLEKRLLGSGVGRLVAESL